MTSLLSVSSCSNASSPLNCHRPVSTATLDQIPDIEKLRRVTKAIALLDAIICPDWEYRYYSYNSIWAPGEEMASMRNGCGDEWFLLFSPHGAALKGLAHEYPLAGDASFAARIQQTVPPVFASFLNEPAFAMEWASFCIWRRCTDPAWSVVLPAKGAASPEADGSAELIDIFDGEPETYRAYVAEYFERDMPLSVVRAFYEHQPLSEDLVTALNPELSLKDIENDLREIGYPCPS